MFPDDSVLYQFGLGRSPRYHLKIPGLAPGFLYCIQVAPVKVGIGGLTCHSPDCRTFGTVACIG